MLGLHLYHPYSWCFGRLRIIRFCSPWKFSASSINLKSLNHLSGWYLREGSRTWAKRHWVCTKSVSDDSDLVVAIGVALKCSAKGECRVVPSILWSRDPWICMAFPPPYYKVPVFNCPHICLIYRVWYTLRLIVWMQLSTSCRHWRSFIWRSNDAIKNTSNIEALQIFH